MPTFSDIETSYVQRYAADVQHVLQQKTTRLRIRYPKNLIVQGLQNSLTALVMLLLRIRMQGLQILLYSPSLISAGELQHDHIMQGSL